MDRGEPTDWIMLANVGAKFEARLPGWWFTVGNCSVSADASCGPDRNGPDAHLLKQRKFDEGFHCDLSHPAQPWRSLLVVLNEAEKAKADHEKETHQTDTPTPGQIDIDARKTVSEGAQSTPAKREEGSSAPLTEDTPPSQGDTGQ